MLRYVERAPHVDAAIAVSNGDKAIAHYKEALGAKVRRVTLPGIRHAALEIGNSKLFLGDRAVQMMDPKGIGSAFYVYVADVDAAHKRALAAGMSEMMAPMDMFWGDRMSVVNDRFGHRWCFATHVRDVGDKELLEARDKQFAVAKASKGTSKRRAKKAKAKKPAKKKR